MRQTVMDNTLFLLNGTLAHLALTAMILLTLKIPSEAILDSGLEEIIMVFEG